MTEPSKEEKPRARGAGGGSGGGGGGRGGVRAGGRARKAASGGAVAAQADHHRRTRRAHATEIAEDYVEMIAELIGANGEARVVDLARGLGVSHVTVVRTISRLQRDGLVSSKPYRSIFLTTEGERLAQRTRARHDTVVALLKALGVSDEVAQADAEGIEHHVSRETLAAFERFVRNRM